MKKVLLKLIKLSLKFLLGFVEGLGFATFFTCLFGYDINTGNNIFIQLIIDLYNTKNSIFTGMFNIIVSLILIIFLSFVMNKFFGELSNEVNKLH